MAPPYSNGKQQPSHGYGYTPKRSHRDFDSTSLLDDLRTFLARSTRSLWRYWNDRGRHIVFAAMLASLRRLRQNLAPHRLLSFPHLLVAFWVLVMLWGERWVFHSRVESCHWSNWENWPPGVNPHHLVFIADPQLIDPHSYPGRPWPINPITLLVTDNYLRRSYNQLQSQLNPDTIFFLGDLFDGGREWKTMHGEFKDPEWLPHRKDEQKYVRQWNKKYGEDYWLKEYARFGDIFVKPWLEGGSVAGSGQRGRRMITSLPGNHDLGFGSGIKLSVRDRFETYFGEGNRVDVIANHTFVSVDTVSLSADTSEQSGKKEVGLIYEPTNEFLDEVKVAKRKAVEKELRFQRGETEEVIFPHKIEDLDKADFGRPTLDRGEGAADFPTILLTHVPLYRPEGTPCGPLREHWPPTKPPKGQTEPVFPDERNSIKVWGGYQYQNVLSELDSVKLIEKIGNVVHAFSGDDHDYCELAHDARQGKVREITVKSISMAMGVPTPGFVMVSLYNPVDADGKPLAGPGQKTLQTHLCLLPTQPWLKYAGFGFFCLILLTVRALLVPTLKLRPFALDSVGHDGSVLPVFKAKVEDYDEYALPSAGFSASRFLSGSSGTRDRSGSFTPGNKAGHGRNPESRMKRHRSKEGTGKWGWAGARAPKIEIQGDDDYNGGKWKAASRGQRSVSTVGVVIRELWTTVFRVAWMVVFFWAYLAWKG
ncbi:putative frost protein [Thozetella sp. PMI_491]|nr:putative frost protein [Thozetella sp. PMI_491]